MEQSNTKGIFKQSGLEAIGRMRKNFLRIGVYVLIGGVILGAALILAGGTEVGGYIGKAMGMFLVFALMMLISSNNFMRLESDKKSVQMMALVGLIANFLWGILWTLVIWEVFSMLGPEECHQMGSSSYSYTYCTHGLSVMGMLTLVVTELSAWGFFGSNIMGIREYDRKSAIMPLKITALICLTYCTLYGIAVVLGSGNWDFNNDRMMLLSGFAGLVWLGLWIVIAVLSRGARKKVETTKTEEMAPKVAEGPAVKVDEVDAGVEQSETEAEMRARIEEKVRREMEIEKEVREKLEGESKEQ